MAQVKIDNVIKRYGSVQVMHGVNVDIDDGEFVVLVGPSGCGKSTLLRMLAGLEEISDGAISIGDRVVNDVPPKERDIAMVFQSYALYPHKTVYDNIGFPLKMAGRDKAEIDKKVRGAADILDLTKYLKRYPKELSGGQRQRVAMGRAIVRDPQVFLFDEPLSNLDAKLRVTMRVEIKELHQRLGTTIVYVTHDQIEAMTMADKIVVMQKGRIEQMGSPLDVYDRPANLFVAGFIGSPSMNFLEGVVRHRDGAVVAEIADTTVPLAQGGLADGQVVVLGVRPEHLLPGDTGLSGQIAVVEPTGAETHLFVRVGPKEVTAILRERRNLRPGQDIRLQVQPGTAHVFDPASGMRIG